MNSTNDKTQVANEAVIDTARKTETRTDVLGKVVDEVRQDAAKEAQGYAKGAVVPKGGE